MPASPAVAFGPTTTVTEMRSVGSAASTTRAPDSGSRSLPDSATQLVDVDTCGFLSRRSLAHQLIDRNSPIVSVTLALAQAAGYRQRAPAPRWSL